MSDIKFHPGSYIKDIIDELNLDVDGYAKILNVDSEKLRLIVDEKKDLDSDIIDKLSKETNTSKALWNNLQQRYDKKQ